MAKRHYVKSHLRKTGFLKYSKVEGHYRGRKPRGGGVGGSGCLVFLLIPIPLAVWGLHHLSSMIK